MKLGRARWSGEFRGGEVKWPMSVRVFNGRDYWPFVCRRPAPSLSPCKTQHSVHTDDDILIKLTKAAAARGSETATISSGGAEDGGRRRSKQRLPCRRDGEPVIQPNGSIKKNVLHGGLHPQTRFYRC